jgi:hypothetical protein
MLESIVTCAISKWPSPAEIAAELPRSFVDRCDVIEIRRCQADANASVSLFRTRVVAAMEFYEADN